MVQSAEWIDGKFLVLTDRTALPPRCVRTNRPVSELEYHTLALPWLPGWLKVVMCVSPAFLLFAPYVVRHRCRLQVGISKQIRYHYLFRKLLACLLIAGAFLIPVLLLVLQQNGAAMATLLMFPFLFWGGFILLILFSSPLTIHEHSGDHFWLAGCSPDFLESVSEFFDNAERTPVS